MRLSDALRQVLRPSSVVATVLLVLVGVLAIQGDLATRPIVRLDVETGGPKPLPPDAVSAQSEPPVLSTYRVRPGDSLSGVARLHGVTLAALLRLNPLRPPYELRAGDVLRIPDLPRPPTGLDPGSRQAVADMLAHWAEAYAVPSDLFSAVAWRESSWRQSAVSSEGAVGVGQVLPTTAEWVSARLIGEPLDPHEVEDNVRLSARYLRWLLDRYTGDVAAALAAYHQGPESVDTEGWLSTSEIYVADVLRLRHEFA